MPADTCGGSDVALSIVTTLYNSTPFLEDFCRRVSAAAAKITDSFELILVNDGSPDDSLETALALQSSDPKIRVIDLSRNFGQHRAMMVGLAHAKGQLLFLIDCDLEEEPELLGRFHEELQASGSDVVYGVQTRRQGGLFRRASGYLFYKMFSLLAEYDVPENPLNARLMSRRYVLRLLEHRERDMYMAGLWAITGYRQTPVQVIKHYRGASNYTLSRKIAMTMDAVVSFSSRPLTFIFYLGMAIMLLAGSGVVALITSRLMLDTYLMGWSSVIVSIWLLGGMTILCLGIIAIYVAKIFNEVKQRPYAIIRDIYEHENGVERSFSSKGTWADSQFVQPETRAA